MAVPLPFGHRGGAQSALERATGLASLQFGSIARRQLLAVGFSSRKVTFWVDTGRLFPRYPGVYAYGRPDLATEGELSCGLLFAGHGSGLGAISALWWLGYLDRRPRLIHVDAPGRSRSRDDLRIRHPAVVEREFHRGLPVVALPQALLASTELLGHNTLRLVLARAEFRRKIDLGEVAAALGSGRAGSRSIRAALAAHLPQLARCESPLEIDFVLLCERFRITMPEPNVRIGRWRPDMLWSERRLVVELDGKDAHSTPAQLENDARKEAHLIGLGYTMIRFTWAEVQFKPEWVAAEVLRALSQ